MLAERFWAKVNVVLERTACWLWAGALTSAGYGNFYEEPGRWSLAHRVMYEAIVGPIAGNMTIDHLCRNRACVRPKHLQVVSFQENCQRRSDSLYREREQPIDPDILTAHNRDKTHCPAGHDYTATNTYRDRVGRRYCKRCQADRQAARRARERAGST